MSKTFISLYTHTRSPPHKLLTVVAEISKYYGDCTASALDHRFRPIKQAAKAMRAGTDVPHGTYDL